MQKIVVGLPSGSWVRSLLHAIVYLIIFSAAWLGLYDWKEAVSIALEILKSVLLPVVTLILGYYFGQGTKSGG